MDRRSFLLGSVAAVGAVAVPIAKTQTMLELVQEAPATAGYMTLADYSERILKPMIERYEQTLIFGDANASPTQFTGLVPRYGA